MFPIRCYTCNRCLAQLHPQYRKRVQAGSQEGEILDELGVHRLCCRRMFLGYVELTHDQARFPNTDIVLDAGGTVLLRKVDFVRVVPCD